MGLVIVLVIDVAVAFAVSQDAKKRDWSGRRLDATSWTWMCLLLTPLLALAYLAMRPRRIGASQDAPAGWYYDPRRDAPFRYWNGDRWTDRTRDRRPVSGLLVGVWITSGLVALGSIGPWLTLGSISEAGLDHSNDGWLTLAAAVIAALVGLAYATRAGRGSSFSLALLGAVVTAIGIYDIHNVESRHAQLFGVDISPSVGWGLWLATLAGVTLAFLGVALTLSRQPAPADGVVDHQYDPVLPPPGAAPVG